MKKRKLKNPRKVMWAMRDFLNEASDLTYEALILPTTDECKRNGWKDDLFSMIEHGTTECFPKQCKMKNFSGTKQGFCAINCNEDDSCFEIGYNIEELFYKGSAQFRKHFEKICPMAKGFADVTITLLHELGHFSSIQEFENYDRDAELEFLREVMPKELINYAYFMLPDENAATMWAVEWLKKAENRKLAKAFEKKFFACFK